MTLLCRPASSALTLPPLQPVTNHNPWMLLYFISFLLIVSFFVLNMFVGVVVENFHKCRQHQEAEEARRREEKRLRRLEKKRRSEQMVDAGMGRVSTHHCAPWAVTWGRSDPGPLGLWNWKRAKDLIHLLSMAQPLSPASTCPGDLRPSVMMPQATLGKAQVLWCRQRQRQSFVWAPMRGDF